ncbi:DUF3073 family protein [Actinocorallia longicatena]|uniref:DUF3073 family protein n=1 Tax=Actinocorallia longicatena TaxID=111803 RepID=A0ABP6QBJ1_9ACTN
MGRGRAKAKQTKIARALKYDGSGTDLDRLRNDLGVADRPSEPAETDDDEYEEDR